MVTPKATATMTKSQQMSRVRSSDTAPERLVRRLLSAQGVRYRLHVKKLPGTPALYIGRLRLAIFVNGCFWHGHDCPRGGRPKSNEGFWNVKLDRNRERDAKVLNELAKLRVGTLTLWQCAMRDYEKVVVRIAKRYRKTL